MEISVSIVDFRSISQSDFIMRNLFSSAQVGQTILPNSGILVNNAMFHSGTSENPLIITLKNSQTETVMYVRNIPVSAILGQRGSLEQWVAMYPPGDPQNLHFDVAAIPKEGQPQILLRVSIEEEINSSSGFSGRNHMTEFSPVQGGRVPATYAYSPASRDTGPQAKVDELRRSVDSLQAELSKARSQFQSFGDGQDLDVTRASSHGGDSVFTALPNRPGSSFFPASSPCLGGSAGARNNQSRERGGLPLVLVDSAVAEKEEAARNIKAYVNKMSKFAKQAQAMTGTLQENLRILESLRRQYQNLEMQLTEQHATTKILERERDQYRADEAQLLEQIQTREIAEQETRRNKNEIEVELQRALGARDMQMSQLDTTTSNFNTQASTLASDIDTSKREVQTLQMQVQTKKNLMSELEMKMRAAEDIRLTKETAQRDEMRSMLDQTRKNLSSTRLELEEKQRRFLTADADAQEVTSRLQSTESEVQYLSGALSKDNIGMTDQSKEGRLDLEKKKSDVQVHVAKVRALEEKLKLNRQQLSDMSMKIADMHTESHEKELLARRCQDLQAELQRKLDAQQRMKASAIIEKEAGEGQLNRAEKALVQARSWWEELEAAVARDSQQSAEAGAMETEVEDKRKQLAKARTEVQELVRAVDELDTMSITQKAVLSERTDALEVARARVEGLCKQLAQATAEIAGSDELLKRLERDAAECSVNVEDARKRLKVKQNEIATFSKTVGKESETEGGRISDLEKTIDILKSDIEAKGAALVHADLKSPEELQKQLLELQAQRDICEEEVKALSTEHAAILTQLQAEIAQRSLLENEYQARGADLESTRGNLTEKIREVAELEAAYKKELEQIDANSASLEAQRADGQLLQRQLAEELCECCQDRDRALKEIEQTKQQKVILDAALEKALADKVQSVGNDEDRLKDTEERLQTLKMRVANSSQKATGAESHYADLEKTKLDLGTKLATISEDYSTDEIQLQETLACLAVKKDELISIQAALKEGHNQHSQCELSSGRLRSEIEILEAKLQPLQAAISDLPSLEASHRNVTMQLQVDGARHKEHLELRTREYDNNRSHIEMQRQEILNKKDIEIQSQILQIDRLESKKGSLTQQVERASTEKQSLEDTLNKNEKTHGGFLTETSVKSHEVTVLESTVREMKTLSSQMEHKESQLQQALESMQSREGLLRNEASQSLAKLGEVRRNMELADAQAQQLLEAEIKQLERQRELFIRAKQEKENLARDVENLKAEEASVQMEGQAWVSKIDELNQTVLEAKTRLAEATANRERQRLVVLEQSNRLKALQEQRPQGVAPSSAQELEDLLQQASDELAIAQEHIRSRKGEEEELRLEVEKLREQSRATSDKLAYQMEHIDLQFETIQQLEEEKSRVENETEDLTMRLHDAETRREYMQNQNMIMQDQIENVHHVSLNERSAEMQRLKVVEEVARYEEDLEAAKRRVDELKQMKKIEMAKVKREHQDTCERLRERISKVQSQIENSEARFRKREANMANNQQRGMVDAPSSAVPGLVVPQRPLPQNAGRRKALLVGINYASSHAPLKGCINDVWNLQCLLRYTLQYSPEQLNLLLDGADGSPPRKECAPTMSNILAGIQWLTNGARPGDSLLFVFCGYGTQHPRPESPDQYEAYIVPSDFAADVSPNFLQPMQRSTGQGSTPTRRDSLNATARPNFGALSAPVKDEAYRLISLMDIQDSVAKLPSGVKVTLLFDCCYSIVPNLHPAQNFVATFPKIERGPDESAKLRDSLSRPRFLQLPVLRVRQAPRNTHGQVYPSCWLYSFSACNLQEWCAEFPIEGTVQGAFTWAFLKAFAACHFHCSAYQLMRMLTKIMTDLKVHFKRIEQTPTLLHSQHAGMNDIVLGT